MIMKIILLFLTIHFSHSSLSQNDTTKEVRQQSYDSLTIFVDDFSNKYYLSKSTDTLSIVLNTINDFHDPLLLCIHDFTPLYDLVKRNYFYNDLDYIKNIIRCYNSYQRDSIKTEPSLSFFRSFNIISKMESKCGPHEETVMVKQPISLNIVKERKSYKVQNGSKSRYLSTGDYRYRPTRTEVVKYDSYRSSFKYGTSVNYPIGGFLSNLEKAVGNDPEALNCIKKYRRKCLLRAVCAVSGISATVLIMALVDSDYSYYGGGAMAPLLFFDQDMKVEYINKTVEIYNQNLLK